MSWSESGKLLFTLYMALNICLTAAFGFTRSLHVFEQVRMLQAVEDLGVAMVCMAIGFTFYGFASWGRWWIGSPIIALLNRGKPRHERRPVNESPGNINMWAFSLRLIGPVYAVALFIVVPLIATWEEHVFRLGTTSWSNALLRTFLFTAMHLIVCVPIGVTVGVFCAGLWLSFCYFHGGVVVSTVHHTTYDCELLLTVMVWYLGHRLMERRRSTKIDETSKQEQVLPD